MFILIYEMPLDSNYTLSAMIGLHFLENNVDAINLCKAPF